MGTSTSGTTSALQTAEKVGLDIVSGALAGSAGGPAGAIEGAAAAGAADLERIIPVGQQIANLQSQVSGLQSSAAKWEAAHPIIGGLLAVMGRLFPSEVAHLQGLIEGTPATPAA